MHCGSSPTWAALMSYGTDVADAYPQVGTYAGRVLLTRTGPCARFRTIQVCRKDLRPSLWQIEAKGRARHVVYGTGESSSGCSVARRRERSPRARSNPSGMRRIGILLPAASDDAEFQARLAAFHQGRALSGWTNRPQRAHRHPLGHGQCRRGSATRGGTGRARARHHSDPWRLGRGAIAAGDPHPRVPADGTVDRNWAA